MAECGKGCMPECEYFITSWCISPFNCPYKIETGYINSATSTPDGLTDLLIEFDEMGFAPTTPCPNSEKYAIGWRGKVRKEIERLKAENTALKERLEKAVELPSIVMIERTLVDGKFKPTQKAQAFNGRVGVVYRDETRGYKGLLVDICSEKVSDYEAAKARLKELKGEEIND